LDGSVGVLGGKGSADKGYGSSNLNLCYECIQISNGTLPNDPNHHQSTLWGHNMEDKKIHWINERILCKRKDEGGPSFKEMEAFNKALLAKQLWRLAKDDSSLVAILLKAQY